MINEPRDATGGCVNDHVLIKGHQVVTLGEVSNPKSKYYQAS